MPATKEALIQKTLGVMGGAACIRRTRIAVWTLVNARRLGCSNVELLEDFPGLTAEDLETAWDYYRVNSEEIDREIHEQESAD